MKKELKNFLLTIVVILLVLWGIYETIQLSPRKMPPIVEPQVRPTPTETVPVTPCAPDCGKE